MAKKGKYRAPDLGSPPSLSSELNYLYQSLDVNNRIIFIKVFKFLWGVVCPASRFLSYSGVLHSYWVVDLLRERYALTPSYLSILSYLYHVTNKNKSFVRSSVVYDNILPHVLHTTKTWYIADLIKRSYLIRSQYKPASTFLPRSYCRHAVFIRLSPAGVRLIESIEKDLHNILMRTSMDELTGTANKKS